MSFRLSEREALETYNKATGSELGSYEELGALGEISIEIEDTALDSGLSHTFLQVLEHNKMVEGVITFHTNPLQVGRHFISFT
jgi:hypothetical protein